MPPPLFAEETKHVTLMIAGASRASARLRITAVAASLANRLDGCRTLSVSAAAGVAEYLNVAQLAVNEIATRWDALSRTGAGGWPPLLVVLPLLDNIACEADDTTRALLSTLTVEQFENASEVDVYFVLGALLEERAEPAFVPSAGKGLITALLGVGDDAAMAEAIADALRGEAWEPPDSHEALT